MRYALVETEIGTFGLAWTDQGLARVALPARQSLALARSDAGAFHFQIREA